VQEEIMSIGETIKKLRKAQNLTQEQFAARLNVSRDLVSKWECDRRKPGFEMLSEIAAVLQTGQNRSSTGTI
jgi:transcriptional regulator with XRE-family HTH domain